MAAEGFRPFTGLSEPLRCRFGAQLVQAEQVDSELACEVPFLATGRHQKALQKEMMRVRISINEIVVSILRMRIKQ